MLLTLKLGGGQVFEIRTESVLLVTPRLAMSVDAFYAQQARRRGGGAARSCIASVAARCAVLCMLQHAVPFCAVARPSTSNTACINIPPPPCTRPSLQATFISSLAAVLGIAPSRIRVARVVPGSAVVSVEISEDPAVSSAPRAEAPFNMTYNMDVASGLSLLPAVRCQQAWRAA